MLGERAWLPNADTAKHEPYAISHSFRTHVEIHDSHL